MSVHERPWPDGTPAWADLAVPDLETARRFYGPVLGWQFAIGAPETGYYTEALVGGRPAAGIGPLPPGTGGPAAAWTTHLATSDVQACTQRAADAGARVVMPPMPVMDYGTMSVLTDPVGATFALWQAGTHPGATVVGEPGAMTWNEHLSGDLATASGFYAALFDYTLTDLEMPQGAYATLDLGGRPVGGVGSLAPDAPAEWLLYFGVRDTDATATLAVEHGGTVHREPEDTPYGRLAGITGPFGERFWLMSTAEPSSPPAG